MSVEIKRFNAILDTDLSETEVDFFSCIDAFNVVYRGDANAKRVQNIIGNTLISNPGLPAGNNTCIGAFYDQVAQRIIWFVYNSNGNHAIFIYNTVPKTIQTLLINGASTDGDILGFTINGSITSIVIIYQEDADGDLLVYLDSLGRPTVINIDFFLNTPYAITKRSFIDLAKAPDRAPVRVTYENDPTTPINNLVNSLFKFRTRRVYRDYMKSVYSCGSITALPNQSYSETAYSPQAFNNRIRACFCTGDEDVIKVELWVQQSTNNVENGVWQLVQSFDKSDLAIPDNSIYQFLFYNDGVYTAADPVEIVQLFDYVPIYAKALELLNGNTVIMANITEGENHTSVNMGTSVNINNSAPVNIVNGLLFFASQSGLDSYGNVGDNITVYLTGTGTNDGSGNPISGLPLQNLTFTVDCALSNGTSVKFSYTNTASTTGLDILNGLVAAAEAKGFTLVGSVGTNSFTISQANVLLYYAQPFTTLNAITPQPVPYLAYLPRSKYQFAPVYFDEKGRTIGTELAPSGYITTPDDPSGASSPAVIISMNSRPPLYAFSWSLVRSPNLTYNKYEGWICNQTFINTDLETGIEFAYIGISNMDQYNEDINTLNPGGTPVVGYKFEQGDRIRFQVQYPVGTLTPDSNILSSGFDYQIASTQLNPNINGIIQEGNFIKIVYPINDVGGNFQFFPPNTTTGDNYQRYRILIYNYRKQPINESEQIFYDFGRQFAIGNPGTPNAFHIGSDQSQAEDLSQPAIVTTADGDFFVRQRNVPAGNQYYIEAGGHTQTDRWATFPTQNPNGIPISYAQYEIGQQVLNVVSDFNYPSYPAYTDNQDELFWNKQTAGGQQVKLKGQWVVTGVAANNVGINFSAFLLVKSSSGAVSSINLETNFFVGVDATTQSYTIPFEQVVTIPPLSKAWLVYGNQINSASGESTLSLGAYTVSLAIINPLAIFIGDASYSDAFNIVTNSNLRPFPYDENAKQTTFETLIRWSLADEFATNVNQINRFYFQNQDEIDRSKGAIVRMKARDRILRIFQQRGCCQKGVYNTFVNDSQGQNLLTTTNAIITINNTEYYEGEFGLGNHPESLVSGKIQDYFFDPVRGYMVRLSQDGLIPVSELYKGQYKIRSLITPYLNSWAKSNGGETKIIGCYNYFEEEWIGILQGGANGSITLPPYAIAFNEKNNSYGSFYGFNQAEWIVSAEEDFYCFLNGGLYFHDNNPDTNAATYCNFFGTQYQSYITTVFNQQLMEKKTYISLAELASQIWECPLIYTNQYTYGTTQQQTKLIPQNFRILEGLYECSFMRDINSPGGWINGYAMKGSYLAVKFQATNPEILATLMEIKLKYITSPLNSQ